MKIIYAWVLFMTGIVCIAQTFGATALDVKGTYDSAKPVTRQWLRQGTSGNVTMVFPQTPNGINEATTLVQGMLTENGLTFDNPDIYRNIDGKDLSNNNNNRNPDTMNASIQKGNSKVNLMWNANDGSMLHLLLSKNAYEVTVMNAYK
ncbi:hypothetical protein R1T16_15980 [Flavobacterium sp. DG1-102-2]|uniref:hypothetical protein n=1 Tax=Flavobacterium sp. DG1-102-2 TaxID=3081663 RepID=UPI0029496314|nr:hypothetical protein [Flavobacterium sp. DG1-102-2]MDV6169937.1 hypothetical protein [Flavobacterium sp. DG1-102-2]